jgi:hypothetical protein
VTTILAALYGSGRVITLDSLVTGQTRSHRRFKDALEEVNNA